ncbi:hypothetical protein [Algoriphagus terrigena]|uniref:hypothetical protein n=1 Tax=Algoriphagus terrigena TaxID=344884 RepID=UPI00041078CD|nr:hypothetical protein [Algoriphagus terrigena]
MKTQLVIYPAMFVMLLTACGEKKDSTTEESIEAQNEISGELHEDDTSMVKRDGTLLDGAVEQMDSVPLPSPVINVIEADPALSTASIVSTRKFVENNQNYFEVTFSAPNKETKTVVFDENGKIKSED